MKLQIATLQPWVFPNNSRTIESDVENSTSILTSIMTTPKLPIFPLLWIIAKMLREVVNRVKWRSWFRVGKSRILAPTFEGSKVGSRKLPAGLPKVLGTPTVQKKRNEIYLYSWKCVVPIQNFQVPDQNFFLYRICHFKLISKSKHGPFWHEVFGTPTFDNFWQFMGRKTLT